MIIVMILVPGNVMTSHGRNLSMLVRINLNHIKEKPQRTEIIVNGVPLFSVLTHNSKLKFLQQRLNRSSGKGGSGEYWFDVQIPEAIWVNPQLLELED